MAISAQTLASSREYFFFLITVTRVPRLNQDAKRQVFPKYHKGKILLINELQPWAMLDYSNSMHTLSAFKLTCLYEENDIYQIWRARVNKINKMLLEPPMAGPHKSIHKVNGKYLSELKSRGSTLIEERWYI